LIKSRNIIFVYILHARPLNPLYSYRGRPIYVLSSIFLHYLLTFPFIISNILLGTFVLKNQQYVFLPKRIDQLLKPIQNKVRPTFTPV
jgi:hypothetical protein